MLRKLLLTTLLLVTTFTASAQVAGIARTNKTNIFTAPQIFREGIIIEGPCTGCGGGGGSEDKMPLAGGTFTGNVLFSADGTYSIGATAATRPLNVYVKSQVGADDSNYLSFFNGGQVSVVAGAQLKAVFSNSGYTTLYNNHVVFSPDNTLDLGTAAATRPRTGYFGTSVVSPLFYSPSGNSDIYLGVNNGAILHGSTTVFNPVVASNTMDLGTSGATFKTGYFGTSLYTPLLTRTTPTATTGASQVGLPIAITASPAVASTDTAGAAAGGSVTITGGAAARNTSGNANGGDINLVGGAGIGTGTTGQVIVPDGVATAPGLALFTNHGTGLYRCGSNCLGFTSGGSDVVRVLSSYGMYPATDNSFDLGQNTTPLRWKTGYFGTSVLTGDGSATVPSFGWVSDADGTGTGFYRQAANQIATAIGGVQGHSFIGGGFSLYNTTGTAPVVAMSAGGSTGSVRVPSGGYFAFNSAADLSSGALDAGISRSGPAEVKVTDGSTGNGSLLAGVSVRTPIVKPTTAGTSTKLQGYVSAPAITAVTRASSGGLSAGVYSWALTVSTAYGESTIGAITTQTATAGQRATALLNPTNYEGIGIGAVFGMTQITAVTLYRTLVGGSTYYRVAQNACVQTGPWNCTTASITFTDILSDAALAGNPTAPAVSTALIDTATTGPDGWLHATSIKGNTQTGGGTGYPLIVTAGTPATGNGGDVKIYATDTDLADGAGGTILLQNGVNSSEGGPNGRQPLNIVAGDNINYPTIAHPSALTTGLGFTGATTLTFWMGGNKAYMNPTTFSGINGSSVPLILTGFKNNTSFNSSQTAPVQTSAQVMGNISHTSKVTISPLAATTGIAGTYHTFVNNDADCTRIVAAAGDTIQIENATTAAAGYVESCTLGATLQLMATSDSTWMAMYYTGEWTDGIFRKSSDTQTIVEANTAGVGSPNLIVANETGRIYTNEGVTAANYHTLPLAAVGMQYTFVVQDADGLRVVANTGDTIRISANVTAAAGYVESTTIGSTVTLTAINATEWIATSKGGVWTNGTWTFDDTSLTTP